MELTKTDYKSTEVGLIPEDWELVQFSDVANKAVKNSITGGPFGSNLKTDDYTIDGVQIIQLQNIGDGKFIDESEVYTSEKKANELKSCNIYPGEIILSKMGDPVARACIIPNKAERFLMASDGIRLVVDEKSFSKEFVFQYINSKYFRNRAIDISTGSTRQRIGLPDLKSLTFIRPTLTEQKAIATALSDVDALISSLEKLIAKKKAIKQGAMQELLKPKEGWVTKKFDEVFEKHSAKNYQINSSEYKDSGEFPVIDQGKSKIIAYSDDVLKVFHCPSKGLIVFGDHTRLFKYIDFDFIVGADGTQLLSTKNGYDTTLLYYILLTKEIPNTGYNRHFKFLKEMSFEVPDSEEKQKSASKILVEMDKEIESLELKKEKYHQIKQGMMQELLTGKTRLV
jgi:type I restriction enzyme S subunit